VKTLYRQYVKNRNLEGSNKASSYIRALDLLDGIIKRTGLFDLRDFWSVESVDKIEDLYAYALQFQKEEGSAFLQSDLPPSYGRNGYYSAALKSYQQFLILQGYEAKLWGIANNPEASPVEVAKKLSSQKVSSIEKLVVEKDIDFSTREGKEVLRETRARVNQDFFRKMILSSYQTQCCVTGLNIPQVLRASHIVAWADDKQNRMNPSNGLCLSATYDAAFDRHLISFDEDFRMILSPGLKEYCANQAFQEYFKAFEGRQIALPARFAPDQQFLQKHRGHLLE
jgi:putative restriction endonuclease